LRMYIYLDPLSIKTVRVACSDESEQDVSLIQSYNITFQLSIEIYINKHTPFMGIIKKFQE